MTIIIGIVVVLGCVIGGFMMEGGNVHILFQPAELVILGGAAVGSLIVSLPMKSLMYVLKNSSRLFTAKEHSKAVYLELLTMLFQLFSKVKKEGLISLEADVENPEKSPLFNKFPHFAKNRTALTFVCDNFKVVIASALPAHELENLMDIEIEANHEESLVPAHSINRVGDALPGFGIVAAVLGVVLAMGKIDQPPAVLGHAVGAALVGTFLGILMSYGFVAPMAAFLEHLSNGDTTFLKVIKVALVACIDGAAPQMAVEFGRRAIPASERPTFSELEQTVKSGKK